jgi:hypothetical protein
MHGAAYDTCPGDNIGFSTDRLARIYLRDQFGPQMDTSVRIAILRAADIEAYGLSRVVSAPRPQQTLARRIPMIWPHGARSRMRFRFLARCRVAVTNSMHPDLDGLIGLLADD